jgi:hypothetical protein
MISWPENKGHALLITVPCDEILQFTLEAHCQLNSLLAFWVLRVEVANDHVMLLDSFSFLERKTLNCYLVLNVNQTQTDTRTTNKN